MQITRCPCPSRCSQRWEPRKPAPPVTTQVLIGPMLQGREPSGVANHLLQFPTFSWRIRAIRGEKTGIFEFATGSSEDEAVPVHREVQREVCVSMQQNSIGIRTPDAVGVDEAARKRAAVELIAKHGASLRRTARRYSLNAEDAEDAYQRSLEILLTKAPNDRMNELVRWTHTVIKHEALAVRRKRERLLGGVPQSAEDPSREDWVAMIPATGDGPDGLAERGELIARSREALRTLKPAELRALTLLAEGYSYAEIGEITGFSQTKVNRCLAEGRERFRSVVARSEDGSRCAELRPLLSAFCDGEASAEGRHRRPRAPPGLRRLPGDDARLPGDRRGGGGSGAGARRTAASSTGCTTCPPRSSRGSRSAAGVVATRRSRRSPRPEGHAAPGMAALAKLLTICAGAAGGAAACVAVGVTPAPLIDAHRDEGSHRRARLEDRVRGHRSRIRRTGAGRRPNPNRWPIRSPLRNGASRTPNREPSPSTPAPETSAGAVEYTPPPPPPPAPSPSGGESAAPSSGSAAGEFGP